MEILTSSPEDRDRLRVSLQEGLVVVALCAAWCNTCTEFRRGLESLPAQRAALVWLDVEDDADLCGDIEVESFPTLVAFRGEAVLHYGVTVPSAPVTARLMQELAERQTGVARVPDAMHALRRALLREGGVA